MRRLLCMLLAAALLAGLCACGKTQTAAGSVSLWIAADDPLAAGLTDAVVDYNGSRADGAQPVAIRVFQNAEQLRNALNTTRPDLLLCSHTLAFSLADRGLLRTLTGLSAAYPESLSGRADCVGASVFPIGSRVQLLASRETAPADYTALCAQAAARGEETRRPWLAVDSCAALLAQQLLGSGEFHADFTRDCFNSAFVSAWNALAEAAFAGGLCAGESSAYALLLGGLPAALLWSDALADGVPKGCSLSVLAAKDAPLQADLRCLAVMAPEGRQERGAAAFLRWLTAGERPAKLALSSGLIPALPGGKGSDPLSALLLELSERTLWLPDGESDYVRNLDAFEREARTLLDLLK